MKQADRRVAPSSLDDRAVADAYLGIKLAGTFLLEFSVVYRLMTSKALWHLAQQRRPTNREVGHVGKRKLHNNRSCYARRPNMKVTRRWRKARICDRLG
jgi:hypothetical protein